MLEAAIFLSPDFPAYSHPTISFMSLRAHGHLFFLLMIGLAACRSLPLPPPAYVEAWPEQNRRYVGPDYWANDLADWRVSQGQLLCVSACPQRSLHLLTQSVEADSGELWLAVEAQLLRPDLKRGFFGFQIGTQAPVDDYRAAAIRGQGAVCGLTAGGELFIGDTARATALSPLDLRVAWRLRLRAEPQGAERYRLTLSVHEIHTDRRLEEISQDSVPLIALRGGLALVSSFADKQDSAQRPTLRFDRWQVGGALLRPHPERAYGPILFARHSLDQQTLLLAAYLAPVDPQTTRLVKLEIDQGQGFVLAKESSLDPLSRVARFQLSAWSPEGPVPYRLSCQIATDSGLTSYRLVDTLLPPPPPLAQQDLITLGLPSDHSYPYPRLMGLLRSIDPHWHLGLAPRPLTPLPDSLANPDHPACLSHLQQWQELGWMMAPLWQQRPSLLAAPGQRGDHPLSRALQGAVHPLGVQDEPQPFAAWTTGGLSLALLDDAGPSEISANPLGKEQQRFFTSWSQNWPAGAHLKLTFSARSWPPDTIPESASRGQEPLDLGWNRVIQTLRQGLALHVVAPKGNAGVQSYRLNPRDQATAAFLSPGLPAANGPTAAWGMIRLDPRARTYTLVAYPLGSTETPAREPLSNWPLVLSQPDLRGSAPVAWLPPLSVSAKRLPVVQVVRQATQQIVYTQRLSQRQVVLPVYAPGRYRIRIWDPTSGRQQILSGIQTEPEPGQGETLRVRW
jgi:hypothetical protein